MCPHAASRRGLLLFCAHDVRAGQSAAGAPGSSSVSRQMLQWSSKWLSSAAEASGQRCSSRVLAQKAACSRHRCTRSSASAYTLASRKTSSMPGCARPWRNHVCACCPMASTPVIVPCARSMRCRRSRPASHSTPRIARRWPMQASASSASSAHSEVSRSSACPPREAEQQKTTATPNQKSAQPTRTCAKAASRPTRRRPSGRDAMSASLRRTSRASTRRKPSSENQLSHMTISFRSGSSTASRTTFAGSSLASSSETESRSAALSRPSKTCACSAQKHE
ncbi:hypothetical protein T492DRAFT_935506 [Pavlovales sp. CCMP2436]|nr:hypothetical protein T492DRAFT_935506 [Pavlovales sp. CCMP2436]